MLEYFKSEGRDIVKLERPEPGCWVNMVDPNQSELDTVITSLKVDRDFLYAALDPEESSRVETEDDQVLLIIDLPVVEHSDSNRRDVQMYAAIPMGIIVTPDTVITV